MKVCATFVFYRKFELHFATGVGKKKEDSCSKHTLWCSTNLKSIGFPPFLASWVRCLFTCINKKTKGFHDKTSQKAEEKDLDKSNEDWKMQQKKFIGTMNRDCCITKDREHGGILWSISDAGSHLKGEHQPPSRLELFRYDKRLQQHQCSKNVPWILTILFHSDVNVSQCQNAVSAARYKDCNYDDRALFSHFYLCSPTLYPHRLSLPRMNWEKRR